MPKGVAAAGRSALMPVARGIRRAGLGANGVTFAGFALTFAGALLLTGDQPALALVLLLVGALADTVDGLVARLEGGGTRLGAFLDSTFDRLSDSALTAATIVVGVRHAEPLLFFSGIVALVAGSLIPYIRAKAESLGLTAIVGLAPREARLVLQIGGVAAWAATGSLLLFTAATVVVALLSSITAVQRVVHVARALRNT